jgi:hypothetical protein
MLRLTGVVAVENLHPRETEGRGQDVRSRKLRRKCRQENSKGNQ